MRRRLIALLAVPLLLPVGGQLPGFAAAPSATGPRLPEQASETAREHAEEALARAEALFEKRSPEAARRERARGGRDATMVLNQLMRARADLAPADRKRADALLARPTAPGGDGVVDYTVREETPHCGVTICVHYVASTQDRPPAADGDGDGVPDMVEQTLTTAESVNDTYVAAGYRRPDPDGRRGGRRNKVDIYLADVGAQGLYGYCTSDQGGSTANRWAYCVVDNDFRPRQFPAHTPLENLQVTLAHEYFHAVQFAYDAFEDQWFMEATATWVEDELFDDVDDNRQYLRAGQLRRPGVPLDRFAGSTHYGNWIFFRFLTERWPDETGVLPQLVLELIEQTSGREGDPDLYSTRAIQAALVARGTSFTKVYGEFADANRRPKLSYSEGAHYPVRRRVATRWLTGRDRRTGPESVRLDHLASTTVRYRPGDGVIRQDWRLRLRVNPPALRTAPVVRVTVYGTDGAVNSRNLRLRRTGASRVTVGFSSRSVKYVELVLGNASRRSTCWRGTTWACQGVPRDNNLRTDFSARIFRR